MNTYILMCFIMISFRRPVGALDDLLLCHDNFKLKPEDGVLKKNTFPWLGFVQYTHVTSGLPHQSKSPRVIIVHPQFVMGTAADFLKLPKNYKLGNVIFGEYDREEEECGMTLAQIKNGEKCPYAYLETPLIDVIPHPEYSRFGVLNSLALVKLIQPIKSRYMVPICLPSLDERKRKTKNKLVFMVDYLSSSPQDLNLERMGKKTLKLYTHKECRIHRMRKKLGSEGVTHVLCSTGCGVRPGAPIVVQNIDGAFELIGVAAGGAPCTRRVMRRRLSKEPPLYIDVYPYTQWVMNVITAHELPQTYPQNFRKSAGGTSIAVHKDILRRRKKMKTGWIGRTFTSGNLCFKKKRKQAKASFFYWESFYADATPPATVNIDMKISAGIECTIVCVRLILPNRLTWPKIEGVGGYNISVRFSSSYFPTTYTYSLGMSGKNTTQKDLAMWLQERGPSWAEPYVSPGK